MISVAVADDQDLVRAGLSAIIDAQDDMHIVGEASDGIEAVAMVRRSNPDVVLIDIRMPRLDGIEATRELVRSNTSTRIVLLTTFDADRYVHDGLRAGASAFLLKDMPRHRLIDAIRLVAEGDSLVAPALTRRLIESYVRRPLDPGGVPTALLSLSTREIEVLKLVAEGMTNAEIAAQLFLAQPTVKSHVGHVLSKLGLRDRVQAVVAAYETGLVVPAVETT